MRIDLSPVSLLRPVWTSLFAAALLVLSGCGSSTSGGADGGAAADGGTQEPGGPVFLSFAANAPTLLDGQALTVTAVLTDPDGVDDIIGGTLLDPETGASYGSFATSASEGAYQITLTWDQLDTVRPIHGTLEGMISHGFRATFFDVAGHEASRDLTVGFDCQLDYQLACGGGCEAGSNSVDSCGECDHRCEDQTWSSGFADCRDARCSNVHRSTTRRSCDAACAAVGWECDPTAGGVAYYESWKFSVYFHSCDEVPAATYPDDPRLTFLEQECWCLEPRGG